MQYPKITLARVLSLTILSALATHVAAEEFPSRPVSWVIPFTPGGITDTNSRVFADEMSKDLGVPVVIDNRPGAGGLVGSEYVARAKGDGYTILYGTLGTMAAAPSLQKKLRYEPLKDFKPVAMLADSPNILVVNAERPYKSVKELVDFAKANPRKVKFSTAGVGTGTHLTAELFKTITGVDMVHVPYQGSAPALTDLIAGRVDIMFDYVVSTSPHIQSGALRPLAVTSVKRMAQLPDVPTMQEVGYPGATTGSWSGIFVPAGTPDTVVDRLAKAASTAAKSERVQNQYMKFGSEQMTEQTSEMDKFVAGEIARWKDIITKAGLEPK